MDQTNTDKKESSSDSRVIHDKQYTWGHITVFESEDKSQAFINIVDASPDKPLDQDDITEMLKDLGITAEIRTKTIDETIAHLKTNTSLPARVLIAEGSPATPGDDGSFEIHFNQKNPIIEKDILLLKLNDAQAGKPGVDIYGTAIAGKDGILPKITCGNNVLIKNENEYYSDIFGKVTFIDNILSVDKILAVKVSDDRMEALLSYQGGAELTLEHIKQELYANNVVSGIDNHAIDFIVSSFNEQHKPIADFMVARGTPPKKGLDGSIAYTFDLVEGPCFKEKEDGSIDIRETNIIQNVKEETEIATITPHNDPVPGKDVYGKVINPPAVTKVSLRAGNQVRASEDGLHYFAVASGRPIIESDKSGQKLSINEVFTVSGDLSLSVGNIDFDGVVEIHGDVEDGFTVKASKSIIIHGLVGASNFEAGVDITINGGCNGKNESTISAGGDIETKYINDAHITARGNLTVKNEIVNSTILSLGRVTVLAGSIRGGKIFAKKGIESYDIGSEIGLKTTLIPGDDFELTEKINTIDESIIEKNSEIEKINKRLAPLLSKKELLPKLPAEQREKIKETISYSKQLRQEKDSLNNTKNSLIEQAMQDALPEVIANHNIYQGTLLKIGKSRREISSQLQGPLRLYEENDRVTVEPYSEKDRKAKEQLLQQQEEKTGDPEPESAEDGEFSNF